MPKKKTPAAMQFMVAIWDNTNKELPHSWERLNHAMRDGLSLAIGAGFTFRLHDIEAIYDRFRGGYWFTADTKEYVYREAVIAGNMSAIKSYEAWMNRQPVIADDVCVDYVSGGYIHANSIHRERERLFVGATFSTPAGRAKVTSFRNGHVVAVTRGDTRKILRVTSADVKAWRKERREKEKARQQDNQLLGTLTDSPDSPDA